MPITFSVDHAAQRIFATATGPVTLTEIIDHLKELERSNCLSFAELINAKDATAVFSSAEMRQIVAYLRGLYLLHKLSRAAIVVSDDATYGMLRMLSILLEETVETNVFHEESQAVEWLGW